MTVGFGHVLLVTALLFAGGIVAVLSRQNIVAILMGIELMLNASALNVVAFSAFHGSVVEGQIVALFIIALAASEAAVAFGILINHYRNSKSVLIDDAASLRG